MSKLSVLCLKRGHCACTTGVMSRFRGCLNKRPFTDKLQDVHLKTLKNHVSVYKATPISTYHTLDISDSFSLALGICVRLRAANMPTMAGPNSPNMSQKDTNYQNNTIQRYIYYLPLLSIFRGLESISSRRVRKKETFFNNSAINYLWTFLSGKKKKT